MLGCFSRTAVAPAPPPHAGFPIGQVSLAPHKLPIFACKNMTFSKYYFILVKYTFRLIKHAVIDWDSFVQ
jgi:hypothetical protein